MQQNQVLPTASTLVAKPRYTRYINRRGYVVRKDSLSPKELARIRKELFVIPYNPVQRQMQRRMGIDPESTGFKIYQENATKLYVPPFYGQSKIGPAEANLMDEETTVVPTEILFHGALRAPQQEVAARAEAHPKGGRTD